MRTIKLRELFIMPLILLTFSSSVMAQAKLPDPRQAHLGGGSQAGPVLPNGYTPGDKIRVEFNSPYVQNDSAKVIDQAVALQQNQVAEESACTPRLSHTGSIETHRSRISREFTTYGVATSIDFCVADIIVLDPEIESNIWMSRKAADHFPGNRPSCKAELVDSSGARIRVVSDSNFICSFLFIAKTTHPEVRVKGYLTTSFDYPLSYNRDGSITLRNDGDSVAEFGVATAEFRD
jgi:hypothetical protein